MTEEIMARLKNRGCRITPQRRLIVEIVAAADQALTAAEVWRQVRERSPDVSLDTVYRNLNMLTEAGVLAPIAGPGKEGARYEPALVGSHHHHIVCVECGSTVCLEYCPVDPELLRLVSGHGYKLVSHKVELYGLCAACRQGEEADGRV